MKANHKLLLSDYKNDKSDLRLGLFVHSLNSNFLLNKKSKEQIKLLLEDYFKDEANKVRLKAIEQFVSSVDNNFKGNTIKPSDMKKKLSKEEIVQNEKNKEEIAKLDELRYKLNAVRRQISPYAQNKKPAPFELIELEMKTKAELDQLEILNGSKNPDSGPQVNSVDPLKSKLDIILGVLGHWEKEGSYSHELVYGTKQRFVVQVNQDVKQAYQHLLELCPKPVRQFWVQHNEIAGGGKGFKPTWTFTAVDSGLAPIEDKFSTIIDGKPSNINLLQKMG